MSRKLGRGSMDDDRIEVDLGFRGQTISAWAVSDESGREFWLPKSQVDLKEPSATPGRATVFLIPEWLAEREGLV